MKTVKQIALPLAAGLLFAVSAYWMFANWLSSILYSMFIIPSYLLMIAALPLLFSRLPAGVQTPVYGTTAAAGTTCSPSARCF